MNPFNSSRSSGICDRRSSNNIYRNDDESVNSCTGSNNSSEDEYHQPEDDYYNNSRNIERPSYYRPSSSTPTITPMMDEDSNATSPFKEDTRGAHTNDDHNNDTHSRSQSREFSFDESGTNVMLDLGGGTPASSRMNTTTNNDNAHSRSLSQGSYNTLSQGSYTGSFTQRSRGGGAHESTAEEEEEEDDGHYDDDSPKQRQQRGGNKNYHTSKRNNDDNDSHSSSSSSSCSTNTSSSSSVASSTTGAEDGTHNEHVQVFLRLRPMNKLELARRSRNCIELHEDGDDYVQHNTNHASPANDGDGTRRSHRSTSNSPRIRRTQRRQQRRRSSRLGSFSDSEEDITDDDDDDDVDEWRDNNNNDNLSMDDSNVSAIQMKPKSLTVDSPLDGQFYDFTFDNIFDTQETQKHVYDHSARNIVRDFVRGYNGCILTYGQTSTGKTHTLLGTNDYVKEQLKPDRIGISLPTTSTTAVTKEHGVVVVEGIHTEGKVDDEKDEAEERTKEVTIEQEVSKTDSPPPSITIPNKNMEETLVDLNDVTTTKDSVAPTSRPSLQQLNNNKNNILTDDCGIIPRAIYDIFDMIRHGPNEIEYIVTCSYVELYLEKFWDLLDPTQPDGTLKHLKLRTNSSSTTTTNSSSTYIDGISEACCLNELDVLALLVKGNACKQLSREHMFCDYDNNKSHTILTMKIQQTNYITNSTTLSTLNFIDLAGSEYSTKPEEHIITPLLPTNAVHRSSMVKSRSVSVTGTNVNTSQAIHNTRHLIQTNPATHAAVADNDGGDDDENNYIEEDKAAHAQAAAQHEQIRLMEAKIVHKSLSALNRVVMALADDDNNIDGNTSINNYDSDIVPYRYSKLTQYLQNNMLGGNCRTVFILTASSSQYNIQETLQTFRFGEDAREIWNCGIKINTLPSIRWYENKVMSMEHKYYQMLNILRNVRDEYQISNNRDDSSKTLQEDDEDDIEDSRTVTEQWDEGKVSTSSKQLKSNRSTLKERSITSKPVLGDRMNKTSTIRQKRLLESINRVIDEEENNNNNKENYHSNNNMRYPIYNEDNRLGYDWNNKQKTYDKDDDDNGSYNSSRSSHSDDDDENRITPKEEIILLKRKLDETIKQRNYAEQNILELQSEVIILKNQTHYIKEECRDYIKQIRHIKKEHLLMQQKRTELEHKLRTSMFRESETSVFFRQFRRFYRRLLKHKASQGSIGSENATSDVKDIIGKVPGVPDLSDLIDVDTLLYEAGLIEESERFDDNAPFTFRPSRKSLSLSYKAARRASKRRSAPAHASSLSYAADVVSKHDQTVVEHSVMGGGRRSFSDGMQVYSSSGGTTTELSTVSMTRQTSIPEHNPTTETDLGLPPMQQRSAIANTSSQDDQDGVDGDGTSMTEASSIASSVTQSIHRTTSVGGGGGGGGAPPPPPTAVHWGASLSSNTREEQLQEEITKLTDKCIKLQLALTDEKSKWDSITDDTGVPLNVRKLQLKTSALKTELDKKSNDLEAVIWKMNELHLINKTYSEKVSNREQNVTYLEQTLSDVQDQCRKMLMERHENEESMSKQLENLQCIVDTAFSLPLWQFDDTVTDEYHNKLLIKSTSTEKGKNNDEDRLPIIHPTCSRNLQSRIRVSLRGGEGSTTDNDDCTIKKANELLVKDGKMERFKYVEEELSNFVKMPVETCNSAIQTEELWPDIEAIKFDAIASMKKETKDQSMQTEIVEFKKDEEGANSEDLKKDSLTETACIATQTEESRLTEPTDTSRGPLEHSASSAIETASIAIQTDEVITSTPSPETTSVSIQTDSCDQECVGTQTETLQQHEIGIQTDKEETNVKSKPNSPEMMDIAIQTENNVVVRECKSISIQTDDSGLVADTGQDSESNSIVQNDSPVDVRDVDNNNNFKTESAQEDDLKNAADAVQLIVQTNSNLANTRNLSEIDTTETTAAASLGLTVSQVRNENEQHEEAGDETNDEQRQQCTIENSTTTNSIQPSSPTQVPSSSKGKSKESSSKERRKRERARSKNKTVDVVPPEELVVPIGEEDEVSILTSHFGVGGGGTTTVGHTHGGSSNSSISYRGGKPSTFVPKRFAPKLGLAIKPGVVRHHHNTKRSVTTTTIPPTKS